MKPQSLVLREVLVLDTNSRRIFAHNLYGANFLLPWAYMDPAVKKRSWDGPTWVYEKNGRKAKANIPLTVELHTGEAQYWDVEDTRRGIPKRVGVKRAHAQAEGRVLRIFDQNFMRENTIELRNRKNGYFLLVNQASTNLAPLEVDVLTELGSKTRTLGQLTARLPHRDDLVRATVMNLWRTGRVELPIKTELMGPGWTVRRTRHA